MKYPMIGKKELFIGKNHFPPELVADDVGTITVTPSTTDVSSQAGTISVPNGAYDEISASVTIIINDVATLMKVFPGISMPAKFDGGGGQVHFGANSCQSTEPVPVIIHNVCDDGSSQDIRIPQAVIQAGGEFDVSLGDPFSLEVNITPLPSEEGYVVFGEGDLEKKTKYNPETQKYEAVAAPTTKVSLPVNASSSASSDQSKK